MKETFPTNELPGSEESKDRRIKTIEITVGEQTYQLEAESYDFEYPKNIQEETGIVGYERTKISNTESLIALEKSSEKFFAKVLLSNLSEEQYPFYCLTHTMGANYNESDRTEFANNFAQNKFFVQKVYDIDYIKSQLEKRGLDEDLFNSKPQQDTKGLYSDITIFDKNTNKEIDHGMIAKIGLPEYYAGLKNHTLFAATPNSGFNVGVGDFFFSHKVNLDARIPSFGFSTKDDAFFDNYLHKALDVYAKEIETNDEKENKKGMISIVRTLIFLDSEIQKMIIHPEEYEDGTRLHFLMDKNNQELKKRYEKIVDQIEINHQIDFDNLGMNDNLRGENAFDFFRDIVYGNNRPELRLPIFIGRDDIPQLSWGHAKYAHYFNEKGFNFFKFKHADHLPHHSEHPKVETSS